MKAISASDTSLLGANVIWAATSENVPSNMCAQRRFRSACAVTQSDDQNNPGTF